MLNVGLSVRVGRRHVETGLQGDEIFQVCCDG